MFPFDDVIMSCLVSHCAIRTGPWFNIKTSSYQFRKSHCGDKAVVGSSYLHNGISYTGKMSSLYWIGAQVSCKVTISSNIHQCLLRYLKHPGKHEPSKGALQPRYDWKYTYNRWILAWCHHPALFSPPQFSNFSSYMFNFNEECARILVSSRTSYRV